MNSIEKKSLKHISKTLTSYDSYPMYSWLNDRLKEENVDQNARSRFLEEFQAISFKQTEKVDEAKGWVDTLLLDD